MIRQLAVLAVAAICLTGSTTARNVQSISRADFKNLQEFTDLIMTPPYPHAKFHPTIEAGEKEWSFQENLKIWTDKDVFMKFWNIYRKGMLPQDHIFSLTEPAHREQAIALFEMLYTAPTLPFFKELSCWAYVHMNRGLFVYSYSVAILHRSDTRDINLVLISQIFPNLFHNTDFMKSYGERIIGIYKEGEKGVGLKEPIWSNYTHSYAATTRDPGTKLTYFLEDIGLNICYYYMHLMTPDWMPSEKYLITKLRGLLYGFSREWITKRYAMERGAYGFKPMEYFDWNRKIATGYMPMMMYENGLLFPARPEWTSPPSQFYRDIQDVIDYEERFKSALDLGYILAKNGTHVPLTHSRESLNLLANIFEGNADSLNPFFYGSVDAISRKILGYAPKTDNENHTMYGAIENPVTSLRDPMFYRLNNKMMGYFYKLLNHLKPRQQKDLIDPHFSFNSFKVDDIITYFETYDSIVSNVTPPNGEPILIKARQTRLNYKNFDYHYDIKSDEIAEASFRVFLGPPFNPVTCDFKHYSKFYLVDYFTKNLTVGDNKFLRHSKESPLGIPDFNEYPWTEYRKPNAKLGFGWPQRLLFPKGTCDGRKAQFYVYVTKYSPFEDPSDEEANFPFDGLRLDNKSWTYPLDEPMTNCTLPNAELYSFKIYHKDESQINLTT